jgi:hypothetical protein
MRIVGASCLAALALGLLASLAVAQSPDRHDDSASSSWNWLAGLLGSSRQSTAKSATNNAATTSTVAQRDAERERLERIFYRRQKVCDRLREIALQKDDPRLEQQAAELEEQAWRLYYEQANRLLGIKSASLEPEQRAGKPVQDAGKALRAPSLEGPLPARFRREGHSQWSRRQEDPR